MSNHLEHHESTDLQKIQNAIELASGTFSYLETIIEILPSPIYYLNQFGVYKYCNQAFCDYLGLKKNQIIEHTVYDFAPINLANIYHQSDLEIIQSCESITYETTVKYPDHSKHDIIFHKTPHLDKKGNSLGLVCIMTDISKQKDTERQIKQQNTIKDVLIHISHVVNQNTDNINFYDLLLDELITAISQADYGTVLSVTELGNLEILSNFGYNLAPNQNFSIPYSSSFLFDHSMGNINKANVISDLTLYRNGDYPPQLPTKDGRFANSCLYIPILLSDKRRIIISLEGVNINAFNHTDINIAEYIQIQIPILHQIFSLNKKTLELSRYDALTGLMNRGYFNSIFEDRLRLAERKNEKLSLIMFDLDGLKIINDNFGHACGDKYLIHFSAYLNNQFRSTDMFARIGGDEFLGIFSTTDPTTLKKKMALLQALYTELPITLDKTSFTGRFSFGIATYPDDADTIDALMTVSDIKMYQDKKNDPNFLG